MGCENLKVDGKLAEMYDAYYADPSVGQKRQIAAKQSVDNLISLIGTYKPISLLDIGAGEGAVLAEIARRGLCDELHALEISDTGCAAILEREVDAIRSVHVFDGYTMPVRGERFGLGLAIHVLEHVEHERAFLHNMLSSCSMAYIEVPLEQTFRAARSMRLSRPYGHINYYTPDTFRNLLETSGAQILGFRVFSYSLEYEQYLSGRVLGFLKYALRIGALRLSNKLATHLMVYTAGALVRGRAVN